MSTHSVVEKYPPILSLYGYNFWSNLISFSNKLDWNWKKKTKKQIELRLKNF